MADYLGYLAHGTRQPVAEDVLPSYSNPTPPLSGVGSPEGVVPAVPGALWTDTSTGNIWQKRKGNTSTGWVMVTNATALTGGSGSGSSGSANVFYSSVDPNGVISATGTAVCFGIGARAGSLWIKSSLTTSSSDWVETISNV